MTTITIEGKIPGQRRPLFTDWQMPLPPALPNEGGRLTLRDLIQNIVRAEVGAFSDRQEQKRLVSALTERDIQAGIMRGKVDMGGRDAAQTVEVGGAIDSALLAFEDGLYYVFVDDEQVERLDSEIYLQPDSRVTFIRLVALAGG